MRNAYNKKIKVTNILSKRGGGGGEEECTEVGVPFNENVGIVRNAKNFFFLFHGVRTNANQSCDDYLDPKRQT